MNARSIVTALIFVAIVTPLVAPAVAAFPTGAEDCSPVAFAVIARGEPVSITAGHDPVFACQGIRPGGALVLRAGPLELVYCTMAFVVEDELGDLYVATAGHCVGTDVSSNGRFSAYGVPGTFGSLAYRWCEGADSAGNGCGVGTDFGLIKVDADKHGFVTAEMCHFGAPGGGLFTARDATVRAVEHFGWGMVVGSPTSGLGLTGVQVGNPVTQARTGVTTPFFDESGGNYAVIESAGAPGDSGSGVMVTSLTGVVPGSTAPRQALGVFTHISVGGIGFVQRLDVSLARAEDELTVDPLEPKEFTVVTG